MGKDKLKFFTITKKIIVFHTNSLLT